MAPPDQLPPPAPPPGEIRDAAKEVLSRPEFQQPPESLYDRAVGWLSDRINDLLSALFEGGRSSVVAWIALVVVIGVIGLLVVRILTSMRVNSAASTEMHIETDVRRPPREWDAEAEEHAANGRWRDAVRCRYRGLVARLAAAGAVDEVPGRTAGEYRLEVRRSRPDAAPPFTDATDIFERAWYSGRAALPEDDAQFRELAGQVLEHATSRGDR